MRIESTDPVVTTFAGEGKTHRFTQGVEAVSGVVAHEAANVVALSAQAARAGQVVVDQAVEVQFAIDPETGRLVVTGGRSRITYRPPREPIAPAPTESGRQVDMAAEGEAPAPAAAGGVALPAAADAQSVLRQAVQAVDERIAAIEQQLDRWRHRPGRRVRRTEPMLPLIERLMRGAIDTHVHSSPDVMPRKQDDFELVRSAADAGLQAIVLKSHHTPTVARAIIAAKYAAPIQVLGGIVLNTPAAGGFNVDAVRSVLRMGGRVVWMPTLSAANHQAYVASKAQGTHLARLGAGFTAGGLTSFDKQGRLRPELLPIFEEIAAADAVLATGHIAVAETLALVDEAQRVGVKRIVVTHPELPLVSMSIADQQALAAKGVFMERCVRTVTANGDISGVRAIAENVRRVGVETTIAATDYGQPESPTPPDGLRMYAEELLNNGFLEAELQAMLQDNPKRLLGL